MVVLFMQNPIRRNGAGGNTFNEVLGTTLNPRNLSAALPGLPGFRLRWHPTAWLAQGSDIGGRFVTRQFLFHCCLRPSPPGNAARWHTLCHSAGCGTDGAECGRCG